MNLVDRHRVPLVIGQRVRVQFCCGSYGQTQTVEGIIRQLYEHHGATLELTSPAVWRGRKYSEHRKIGAEYYVCLPGSWVDDTYICHKVHHDFEHGHEAWVEIVSDN